MKKRSKFLAVVLCFALFASMALGSGSSSDGKKEASKTKDGKEAVTVTIEEQVILDEAGIKITATEYSTDTILGEGIKLQIENNSDRDCTVGCDALIVNDYNISDLFASEIAAGKKANEVMYLSSPELNAAGIDVVGKVEMYFHAYDSDYNDMFTNVYSEIKTSEYENMDTKVDDAGTELYNEGGIRIVGKTVDENSFWGTAILLYVENTSGRNAEIQVESMSINGYMMDPIYSAVVYDGKKNIDEITIFSSDLEANGITSIDEIELKFNIFDPNTFETIIVTEPITFSAK